MCEQAAAFILDTRPRVKAFVKNAGLDSALRTCTMAKCRRKNATINNNEIVFYTQMVRRALMSDSEMQAELERLRAENAQLKNKDKGGLTLKVSEKGGLSLYGMGRFPVTLYKEQWLRILASAAEIEAFIRDNDSKLKAKE